MAMLKKLFDEHVRAEENELFTAVRKQVDDAFLNNLSSQFKDVKAVILQRLQSTDKSEELVNFVTYRFAG